MKALFVAAVLAVSVTPAIAGNGWSYGNSSSAANCKPNSYGSKFNSYDSWSNRSNNYSSRLGYSNSNRWSSNDYIRPTRFNSASSYYNYDYPAVRNTRYDNSNHAHHLGHYSFSPWSPSTYSNYNRLGY